MPETLDVEICPTCGDEVRHGTMGEHASDLHPDLPPDAIRIPDGDLPSWRTSKPQAWYDGWRRRLRLLRFRGQCVVCNRRTYAFDDGENDPRGVLGDHAASALTAEDDGEEGQTGEDVPACFLCMNEEPSYRMALAIARRRWAA